ncbi:hypothetical protein MAM1_0332c09765 [Mucor ambiguus]|uniref:Uncharacterized protein n=1 Tax=Mucor ambiguus TaxID=91626 RepID=A0A0C9N2H2_9FUNG|nr:hypothetical protein MAM1_0332c09765 [Mucor ambiguus]
MTQQTLGIISLNIKDDILNKIATMPKVKLVYEQQFDLTAATSLEILDKTISKTLPVCGFILEGSNAIRDWSQITSSTASLSKRRGTFVHASTMENAQHQVDWFKNLVLKDMSVEKNTSTTSNTSSSSIPIKVKKQQQMPKSVNVSDNSPQRKPLRSGTPAQQQSPSSRLGTSARKPAVTTTNRSKVPNANVKAKTVTSRPTSATTTTTTTKTPATSSVTPTKRVNDGMKPASGRRGSLVSSTLAATSSKKLLSTTSKGGVIKNTPPVSVLTGRTRKPSRLTEKRPVVVAASAPPDKIDSVKEEEQTEEIKPEIQQEALSPPSTPTPTTRSFEEAVEHAEAQEAPCDTAIIQEQQIVSYPSTCSSAATDEHDAEVAATTSKKDTLIASSTHTATVSNNNSSVPLLCNSGRSSFSPTSIASLPRPETPEVDQLRLRFETIIQTSAPVGNTQDIAPRRPSSKLSQHEFASRIKEMKPRGPVGSRVKSMVELFMDENLNKWEF